MKEQFWGLLWQVTNRLFGVNTHLSRWLEDKWAAAYWADQPPLSETRCSTECEARHG